jgi:hypothetical protein
MGLELALFALSFAFQMVQMRQARKRQKKAEAEAAERADRAKGFIVTVEGEASQLPVCYGRNLIGGVRVYHHIRDTYSHAEPAPGGSAYVNGGLNESKGGRKNEYMYIQQAVAYGGLSSIIDVQVDGKRYNDSYFSRKGADDPEYSEDGVGALRIHVYPEGGLADPMAAANDEYTGNDTDGTSNRDAADFPNTAYVSGVFRLNRDDYQFSGAPDVKLFAEGKEVYTITGTEGNRSLSSSKTYSNNPALCLLDYLLDTDFGRGLPVTFVDLESFYQAYWICDKTVIPSVPKEGVFWKQKGGTREIKLYECNISLDTNNSIRDNIEVLLDTMGQAELSWSDGLYKLSLKYPTVWSGALTYAQEDVVEYDSGGGNFDLYRSLIAGNTSNPTIANWATDVVSAYITDDDIIRGGEVSVGWPSAQDRYNHVTVRFLNEAVDFREDAVSWPPKDGTIAGEAKERGIWSSGTAYTKSDIVTYSSVKYQKTNGIDIVDGTAPNVSSDWILYNISSVYNTYIQEDYGVPLETEFFESGTTDYYHALNKAEERCRASRNNVLYKLRVGAHLTRLEPGDIVKVNSTTLGIPGVIMRIESLEVSEEGHVDLQCVNFSAAVLAWNAPDDEVVNTPSVFNAELAQASGLSFSPNDPNQSLTGGSLTWVAADDVRVNRYRVKYTTTPVASITNATTWIDIGETASTNFSIPPIIAGPYVLTVVASSNSGDLAPKENNATGSKWPELSVNINGITLGVRLTTATIYRRNPTQPTAPSGGTFDFDALGMSVLPTDWFGAPPAGSDTLWASSAIAESPDGTGTDATLTWAEPLVYINTSYIASLSNPDVGVLQDDYQVNYDYAAAKGVFNVYADTNEFTESAETTFTVESQTGCTVTINNVTGAGKGEYSVTDLVADTGSAVLRVVFRGFTFDRVLSVTALKIGVIRDLTPPPAPTNITVTTALNSAFISQDISPAYTEGHGHARTEIWGVTGASPLFSNASLMATFEGNKATIASTFGTQLTVWLKWISNDGVTGPESAVGIDATTGKIGNADLGDLIVEAGNLANDSVTGDHLAPNSIAVGTLAVQDGAIINAMIGNLAVDSAQIAVGAIDTIHIGDAQITNTKIGNIIQSAGFVSGLTGWQINKAGSAEFADMTITDGSGNIILSSGTGVEWTMVNGSPTTLLELSTTDGNKLAGIDAGADVTAANVASAIAGQGAFATLSQITSANISTYMAGAAIGFAQIGTAAIKTAAIEDLAVNTLKIAGRAVTNPLSYWNPAKWYLGLSNNAWRETSRLSIVSTGEPIQVLIQFYMEYSYNRDYDSSGNGAYFRVQRNGTTLQSGGPFGDSSDTSRWVSVQLVDTPGVGTFNYNIDIKEQTYYNNCNVSYRSIILLEVKR